MKTTAFKFSNLINTLKYVGIASMFLVGTATFTGCKQEGCTDARADNYDPDAEEDDGSCNEDATVAKFTGTFSVSDNCSASGTATYTVTITQSSTQEYKIVISNFWNAFNNPVTADVSQRDITIPNQEPDSDGWKVQGSGQINSSGDVLNINYTVTSPTGQADVCQGTFTKQ